MARRPHTTAGVVTGTGRVGAPRQTAKKPAVHASELFAQFIWEAVKQEVESASHPESIVNAIERFRAVLDDAPQGSKIWTSIKRGDVEALAAGLENNSALWTPEVEAAYIKVRNLLAADTSQVGHSPVPSHKERPVNSTPETMPKVSGRPSEIIRRERALEGRMHHAHGHILHPNVTKSGIRVLILATHPRLGAKSPARKLTAQPNCFRVINEYLVRMKFHQLYRMGRRLGVGGHSVVREATHLYRRTEMTYASKATKKSLESEFEVEMLRREAAIMRSLHHPNIPEVVDFIEEENHCFLVVPAMKGGDMLERILMKPDHHYSEATCIRIVRTLANTLAYCHANQVVHRDIKPENILFETADEDSPMQLVDFGFAQDNVRGHNLLTACGTPQYAAPEILHGLPHGVEVDCWSLGVLTYILLCGYPPFYHDDERVLFRLVKSGRFEFNSPNWDPITSDAKDFIRQMLVVDANSRVTMKRALRHRWLTNRGSTVKLGNVSGEVAKFRNRNKCAAANQTMQDNGMRHSATHAVRAMRQSAVQEAEDLKHKPTSAEATRPAAATSATATAATQQQQQQQKANDTDRRQSGVRGLLGLFDKGVKKVSGSGKRKSQSGVNQATAATARRNQRASMPGTATAAAAESGYSRQRASMPSNVDNNGVAGGQQASQQQQQQQRGPAVIGAEDDLKQQMGRLQSQLANLQNLVIQQRGEISRLLDRNDHLEVELESARSDGGASQAVPGSFKMRRNSGRSRARSRSRSGSHQRAAGVQQKRASVNAGGGAGSSSNGAGADAQARVNMNGGVEIYFSLEDLQNGKVESQIDPTFRERYLTDADFLEVMKCTKAEFEVMPKWKKMQKKKNARLF